jgi:hypothetical protein
MTIAQYAGKYKKHKFWIAIPHSAKTIIQSGKLQKKCKRPQISIPPIRKSDRSWAKSDLEKAKNFAEHLSQVFTPHNSKHHHNNDEIEKFLDVSCQMSLPIKAFSPREVRQVIEK